MRRRVCFIVAVVTVSLLSQGCALRLPTIPDVRKVEVSAVVKTKPLSIGGVDSTSVDTSSFARESGKKIDPETGQKVDGAPGDAVRSYQVADIPIPDNLTDALQVDVEAVYFQVALPPAAVGDKPVALTVSAPGQGSVVLVTSIKDGENKLELSAADREALSRMLENAAALNVDILADDSLGDFTIADLQLQAAATFSRAT
jgi:hypothetical protein